MPVRLDPIPPQTEGAVSRQQNSTPQNIATVRVKGDENKDRLSAKISKNYVSKHSGGSFLYRATLHSLFRLPVPLPNKYQELPATKVRDMQELFSNVRYLIVDEKSMIGLQMLYWIDRRCHQIFPDRRDEPFAGLNIILAGACSGRLSCDDGVSHPGHSQWKLGQRVGAGRSYIRFPRMGPEIRFRQ
ncbi:hypothetical protein N7535_002995 [Penicillium sp. DV-2018c]|nr:hypothetical protein N7535_002995 [Penicillium sp. DV-2018c]